MSNCCTCGGYHEMDLDWLILKIKEALAEWDITKEDWEETKQYITDYFKNLDVQEEIDNAINELYESGKLDILLNTYIPYVTPEMYGAVGDGITNDTQSVIDCINASKTNGKFVLMCAKDVYKIDQIETEDYKITGNVKFMKIVSKSIINPVIYGSLELKSDFWSISNGIFNGENSGIIISNGRYLEIKNNIFIESSIAIDIKGNGNFHDIGSCKILNNVFNEVNIGINTSYLNKWDEISDILISGNVFNTSISNAIKSTGIDGMKITDNYMFMHTGAGYTGINIEINGTCNFIIISENSFFTSGKEQIKITTVGNINICDNHFTDTGYSITSDAIVIDTADVIICNDNNFYRISGESCMRVGNVKNLIFKNNFLDNRLNTIAPDPVSSADKKFITGNCETLPSISNKGVAGYNINYSITREIPISDTPIILSVDITGNITFLFSGKFNQTLEADHQYTLINFNYEEYKPCNNKQQFIVLGSVSGSPLTAYLSLDENNLSLTPTVEIPSTSTCRFTI